MGGGGEGIGREPLRAALLRPVEKSDQAIDKLGRLNLLGQVERDFRLRLSDPPISTANCAPSVPTASPTSPSCSKPPTAAGAGLVDLLFDLLELNGEQIAAMPLSERKSRLAALLDLAAPRHPIQRP